MFEWNGAALRVPEPAHLRHLGSAHAGQLRGQLARRWAHPRPGRDRSHVVEGQTLAELSAALDARLASFAYLTGGVHLADDFVEKLTGTVEHFNAFARAGHDEDFHRGEPVVEQYFNNISLGSTGNDDGPTATARLSTAAGLGARDGGQPHDAPALASGAVLRGNPRPWSARHQGRCPHHVLGQVLDHAGEPIGGLYAVGNCAASPSGQGYWGPGHHLRSDHDPGLAYGPGHRRAGLAGGRAPPGAPVSELLVGGMKSRNEVGGRPSAAPPCWSRRRSSRPAGRPPG